jgi:glycosyltransferase involved in cell wall biosynthesis
MRIFLDCTHTALHPYKNTGIHRLVRRFATELNELTKQHRAFEVHLVMFDSATTTMRVVQSLEVSEQVKRQSFFDHWLRKVAAKLAKIFKKLFGQFISQWSKPRKVTFENHLLSSDDWYLIVDANWDLPDTYYSFLSQLKAQKANIALVCYDLIPMKFPEFCSKGFSDQFSRFMAQYAHLFDKVLCISQRTVDDFLEARGRGLLSYNLDQAVLSFNLGSDFTSPILSPVIAEDSPIRRFSNKQYVLVVGSLAPHKNIKATIAAFNQIQNRYPDLEVIFAGNRGWHPETDGLITKHPLYEKRLHILSGLNDQQISFLYQHCFCLVQASFYEGYGLPVVEALSRGKPVIASQGGSLPEVGGDFCLYFDPHHPPELADQLGRLLESPTFYDALVQRIQTEYRPVSWRESAQQVLDLLLQ